eukprot:gene47638-64597_t
MKIVLRLDDLTVFVRTAEEGSLSAAARAMEISPALASAALKRLEGELGLRLFARTTRSLRLTDEGERYLVHAREALRLLKEGHDTLMQAKEVSGGTLKLGFAAGESKGRKYVCGEVQTNQRFGYGAFEVRMKAVAGSGLNTGFFSYIGPVHKQPHDEIDFEVL